MEVKQLTMVKFTEEEILEIIRSKLIAEGILK